MGSTANKMKLNCKEGYAFELGSGRYLFTPDGELKDLDSGRGVRILKKALKKVNFDSFDGYVVGLFINNECNLRCKYCYVEDYGKKVQDMKNIKKFLNSIVKINPDFRKNGVLVFFAGGEPTLSLDLIKKTVRWCNENIGKLRYSITTNGVLSRKSLDWLIENMDEIAVSCDGPPEIQDRQRPLKGGGGSSRIVERTIETLASEYRKPKIVICCITSKSLDKIEKIMYYFYKKNINLGFYKTSNPVSRKDIKKLGLSPESSEKYKKIIELKDILNYPPNPLTFVTDSVTDDYHCKPQIMLTLDNYVSFCSEIYKKYDDHRKNFIYGKLGKRGIEIDRKKLDLLKKRKGTSLKECRNCTLVKACAGQCPARALEENDTIFSVNRNLCELTRNVFHDYLVYQVHKNFIRIKPYIREGKNLEFEMVFNRFKLGDNEFRENPYLEINKSNFNSVFNDIAEYSEKNIDRIVFLSFRGLPPEKSLNFIKRMETERIPFFVTKPVFSCNGILIDVKKLGVPVSCRDCLELYRVTDDGKVRFCTGQAGKDLSEYDTRKEIYEEFLKLDNRLSGACKNCIHKLRGNCDGKYCE